MGVLARSLRDAPVVLNVVQGVDASDPYSRMPLEAAKIVVPGVLEFFGDRGYEALFKEAIFRMQSLGARVAEINFESFLEVQALLYEGPRVRGAYGSASGLSREGAGCYPPGIRAVDAFLGQYKLAALR